MRAGGLLLLCLLMTGAIIGAAGCHKQGKKHVYTVGIVNPSSTFADLTRGFKEGMAERGYREGHNIEYLREKPLGSIDQVPGVVRELIDNRADLVFAMTTPGALAVKKALAGTGIPIVFGPVFSPDTSHLVKSLSQPGENLTGIKVRGSTAKALELLATVVPDLKTVCIPFHYTDDAACLTVEDLHGTAKKLGISLVEIPFEDEAGLERSLATIPGYADAIWLTCSSLVLSNVEKIARVAREKGLPVASSFRTHVDGVMLSYGEDEYRLGKQVSRLADRILKGEAPAGIPVETSEFFLTINLKAASDAGIEIPEYILQQADTIIR